MGQNIVLGYVINEIVWTMYSQIYWCLKLLGYTLILKLKEKTQRHKKWKKDSWTELLGGSCVQALGLGFKFSFFVSKPQILTTLYKSQWVSLFIKWLVWAYSDGDCNVQIIPSIHFGWKFYIIVEVGGCCDCGEMLVIWVKLWNWILDSVSLSLFFFSYLSICSYLV